MTDGKIVRQYLQNMRTINIFLLFVLMVLCGFSCPSSVLAAPAAANTLWLPDFTLHKFGSGSPGVLIVGGIQGDEPGGFSAATILATHYQFTKGQVWIVPNLNFPSIIKRSRGLTGDMNRKFARLEKTDPEYTTVRRIQDIICTPDMNIVLNLHDGSGFFRPTFENKMRNPNRWGQSLIIDMNELQGTPFGKLEECSYKAIENVNSKLLQHSHMFHLKNTKTNEGNPEMEKTLTWFAVRNGKAAYGLEASKDFTIEERAYYHLLAVEGLLQQYGIEFTRDFTLSPDGVKNALQQDIRVAFGGDRFVLPLEDIRPRLGGHIPLPKDPYATLVVSKPIIAVSGAQNELQVHYGNRLLTRFKPEWHESDHSLSQLTVYIDGEPRQVKIGDMVVAQKSFKVSPTPGYRINAIGTNKGVDESDIELIKTNFLPQYSVDKSATIYRVEAYKGKQFAGMFLVKFGQSPMAQGKTLPDTKGPESDLGR